MQRSSIVAIFERLNAAHVRYIVVGGLAVVAHGHVRFTADIDLVLDMSSENLRVALETLGMLGYTPRAPVPLGRFADAEAREGWIRDKGLTVFSLWSAAHPSTEIDLFVSSPFDDFATAHSRAAWREIAAGVEVSFASLEDLVELKRAAARPEDLLDVERLLSIRDGKPRDDRVRETQGEWEVGWDGHTLAQATRLAALPLVERIGWLEEAQLLAARLSRTAHQPRPLPDR